MNKIKLTALPCICVDVFDGIEMIRPGGEALNFAVHASRFTNIDVTLLGVIGKDKYAEVIMDSIAKFAIDKKHIRIDERHQTANNMTYLTESGDRYYKDDSWNGSILDNIVLNDDEIKILSESDVVFVHFWASCLSQVIELKKTYGFKLVVDFDVYRDFADMERFAPYIDFFLISGSEELLPMFRGLSNKYNCLFNVSLAEHGSVTLSNLDLIVSDALVFRNTHVSIFINLLPLTSVYFIGFDSFFTYPLNRGIPLFIVSTLWPYNF